MIHTHKQHCYALRKKKVNDLDTSIIAGTVQQGRHAWKKWGTQEPCSLEIFTVGGKSWSFKVKKYIREQWEIMVYPGGKFCHLEEEMYCTFSKI